MSENLPAARPQPLPIARRAQIPEQLGFADVRDWGMGELSDRGTGLVRAYAKVEHVGTQILKDLAAVLIAGRLQMGDPTGGSYAYKQWAEGIYGAAGIPEATREKVHANVRYHISSLLREVVPADELEALGVDTRSAKDRGAARRKVQAAVVATHRAADAVATTKSDVPGERAEVAPSRLVADHLRLAEMISKVVGDMEEPVIRGEMTPQQRAVLDERLADAIKKLQAVRAVIRSAGKRPSS
ncbi:hypothetical protein [Kitasatospora purpeofusca]|uniref:hypothetical protein n=1 Tax=Kitasatospora purpeofusca TaxID=67352 RepID=UPI0036C5893D